MILKKGLTLGTLLVLIVLLVSQSGCSLLRKEVRLYPIEKSDIFNVPKGAIVLIPKGTVSTDKKGKAILTWPETKIPIEKQGWFVSDFWLDEVGEIKIGR